MKTQIFGFLAAYATMAATQRNIKNRCVAAHFACFA